MSRDILPIREIDYDLLRRELELDPTRRGYGGLAAVWQDLPTGTQRQAEFYVGLFHREALAEAMVRLLVARTLRVGDSAISRAEQLGFVRVVEADVRRAMELDSRK